MATLGKAASSAGFWASTASAAFSIIYVIAQVLEWQGFLGSAGGPDSASTALGLAVLLTPSLLLGGAFVVTMTALHQIASDANKIFSQAALAFAIMYATLTGLVYYVQLTLIAPRIAADDTRGLEVLLFVPYKSFLFAVDLLGYSFMSVATVFAAAAVSGLAASRFVRLFLLLNGCLLPFLLFQMLIPELIYVAALWAVTFPCAMIGLAIMFGSAGKHRNPPSRDAT